MAFGSNLHTEFYLFNFIIGKFSNESSKFLVMIKISSSGMIKTPF